MAYYMAAAVFVGLKSGKHALAFSFRTLPLLRTPLGDLLYVSWYSKRTRNTTFSFSFSPAGQDGVDVGNRANFA